MRKKIIIIIILIIVLCIMLFIYLKPLKEKNDVVNEYKEIIDNKNSNEETKKTSITFSTQITSGLEEQIELHATNYLEEVYVEENQLVKKDEKILKYTDGTYLVAPYDLIITSINVPNNGEKVTNKHYIEVCSNNILSAKIKVDETKIDNISIGDEATLKVSALDNLEVKGIITNISNTASNGKFTVTIEFENNSDLKIGMSISVSI